MNDDHRLIADRRQRAERLGHPYPASVKPHQTIGEVFQLPDGSEAAVAGRLITIRSHGKAAFATLRDGSASSQLYFKEEGLGEAFARFSHLAAGDFIWASGRLITTGRGEKTLEVSDFEILGVAHRPLPEKYHGLKDTESRYRQRYLDLLANEESRRRFEVRSRTITAMRSFLDDRGFLEVETPVLQPIYGGALAKPFVTHHEALDMDLYLRIADELYLKRLIVGGLDRVYEIGHDFRNEGLDTSHNTEFTMMECYQAYADYTVMMELTETLISSVAGSVLGSTQVTYQGQSVELRPPWKRLTVHEALREHAEIDLGKAKTLEQLQDEAKTKDLKFTTQPTWAKQVDDLIKTHVRPQLIAPTFLIDYPVEMSPLAKRKEGSEGLVERFQPIIAGLELGNAYSELNDPTEQRARFEEQARARAAGDEETQALDEDFITALEHGMPPTGGLGIGVDRLVMLLTDTPSIRDVILFPQLRPGSGSQPVDNIPEKA